MDDRGSAELDRKVHSSHHQTPLMLRFRARTLLAVVACLLATAAPSAAWVSYLDGTTTDSYDPLQPNDLGRTIAVDTSGDVITGGRLNNLGTSFDFTVAKFSGADGTVLWHTDLNGTDGSFERVRHVSLDSAGDVFAVGRIKNVTTHYDFAVAKLSGSTGSVVWLQEINGSLGTFDWAWKSAVTPTGDVVVVGRLNNVTTGYDFSVIKFRGSDGVELWRQELNGTSGGFEWAKAVAVDAAGNVFAGGRLSNLGAGYDWTVVKLDGNTGAELWRQSKNGTNGAFDWVIDLSLDGTGNVYCGGKTDNLISGYDFTVAKYDASTGAQLWETSVLGTNGAFDEVLAMSTDSSDNPVAAGRLDNQLTGYDFTVIKFASLTGSELWRQEINGDTQSYDRATSVALDASDNVIAAGRILSPLTNLDLSVVKIDGATGTQLWRQNVSEMDTLSSDEALAVAVTPTGDAVATGRVMRLASADDFAVVQLRGSDGIYNNPVVATDPSLPNPNLSTYPNPFSSVVSLAMAEDPRAPERVVIHDVRGRVIRELDASSMTTGRVITWDGRDSAGKQAAAGIYFVQVLFDHGSTTCKVSLVR